MINATGMLYQIFLYDNGSFSDLNQEKSYKLMGKKELEAIISELNIQRYKDYATEFSAHISKQTQTTELVVLIDDLNLLKRFSERLKSYNNVHGNVLEYRFERHPEAEMTLMPRVLKKGFKKAKRIGELVDKEIGELLSVEEEHMENLQPQAPYSSADWTIYPPLSALPSEASKPRKARLIVRKRVKLRFAWK